MLKKSVVAYCICFCHAAGRLRRRYDHRVRNYVRND